MYAYSQRLKYSMPNLALYEIGRKCTVIFQSCFFSGDVSMIRFADLGLATSKVYLKSREVFRALEPWS